MPCFIDFGFLLCIVSLHPPQRAVALGFSTQVMLVHSLPGGSAITWSSKLQLAAPVSPDLHSVFSRHQHLSGLKEGMRHVSPISLEEDGNPFILLSFYRIISMDPSLFSYIFIILLWKQKSHFFLLPTRIPNDPNFLFLSQKCHATISDLSPSRPSAPHAHCHGMPS